MFSSCCVLMHLITLMNNLNVLLYITMLDSKLSPPFDKDIYIIHKLNTDFMFSFQHISFEC